MKHFKEEINKLRMEMTRAIDEYKGFSVSFGFDSPPRPQWWVSSIKNIQTQKYVKNLGDIDEANEMGFDKKSEAFTHAKKLIDKHKDEFEYY